MNRFSFQHALMVAMLTLVASAGCQKKPSDVPATVKPATVVQLTPEERFELVVKTFRRGVEDIPISFVVQDGAGTQTMMTGRNDVSHELLPPTKEGEPYRATITVKSQSRYTLQRLEESDNSADSKRASDGDTAEASSDDGSGVEIFDPDLVSAPGAGSTDRRTTSDKVDKNAVTVARRPDEHERTYDLVYEKGRWKLVSKLDLKTEKSIQFAFDRALESQS